VTAVFVTATGTDIGKTFVTAGLVRHLRGMGRPAAAIKPIVSGFDPEQAEASDPANLLAAMGRAVTAQDIAGISPWRFQAPLSPDFAARREGRSIDFAALVDFSRRAVDTHDMLFIEGVGGIMVPLDQAHTVLDWLTALHLPLILVAGSYVGTLSHTLTALHVLAQRNLSTLAVVVSETPGSPAPLDETVATVARFADALDVIGLPRLAAGAPEHPAFAQLAALL
jgi:dethiobiotin synthetase